MKRLKKPVRNYCCIDMKENIHTIVVRIEITTLLNASGKISRQKMDRLAMAMTNLHNSGKNILIVSSGAIVLGSDKLKLPQLPVGLVDMQATAAVGQAELIRHYQQYFSDYNQIVAQVLLTRDIAAYPQRVENTRNTFNTLLEMNIIPIINENDPISAADIEIDDNYPLALVVAHISRADFIVIKMEMNGKYMIVPRGKKNAIIVENELELQDRLNALCSVLLQEDREKDILFPASIGEIEF